MSWVLKGKNQWLFNHPDPYKEEITKSRLVSGFRDEWMAQRKTLKFLNAKLVLRRLLVCNTTNSFTLQPQASNSLSFALWFCVGSVGWYLFEKYLFDMGLFFCYLTAQKYIWQLRGCVTICFFCRFDQILSGLYEWFSTLGEIVVV